GLKLGCASSKGSPQGNMNDDVDIDGIPDTLSNDKVDTKTSIGSGVYKDAYNFKGEPGLVVLLLKKYESVRVIFNEIEALKKLNTFGIKTPEYYKQIRFVDKDSGSVYHGLVVQKIKGAKEVKLTGKNYVLHDNFLPHILNYSNDQTLKDIKHLQKVFAQNPGLDVADFQGLIAEDGQLYIMDPLEVTVHDQDSVQNLDSLQILENAILRHHKRFIDKTTNHITYIDKQLWESNDALKQQMLSDAQKDKNKVIVSYDFAKNKKSIVYQPDDRQRLAFDTIEVITNDPNTQSADLKKNSLKFAKKQGWNISNDFVFRANTFDSYTGLNLKSNNKNKYSIILQLGSDDIAKKAAQSLFDKRPHNSIIITLDEQGKLVFPPGVAFTPDDSVRFNIVGFYDDLQQTGAQQLADYTDATMKHYNVDLIDNNAYLNRAALVGCKSEEFSKAYAQQLYKKPYLRGADVTGREGDIQVNPDGSKTMQVGKNKIIHSWNYEHQKLESITEGARHIGDILNRLRLGLGDGVTALDIPHSLTQDQIGKFVGEGSRKSAYTLNNYPNFLFLQLSKQFETESTIEQLSAEVEWVNKFRDMGVKTPKYIRTLTMTDKNQQVHHGVLVEHIQDALTIRADDIQLLIDERITHRTLADIQTLLQQFDQHLDLSISDLQMLMGRDGQLYVFDPANSFMTPSIFQMMSEFRQTIRTENMSGLKELGEHASSVLKKFDRNKGVHAIFVDEKMLQENPNLKEELLNKAKKQQDLSIISYDSNDKITILHQPEGDHEIGKIEVMVDKNNRFIKKDKMLTLLGHDINVSSNMVFRHTLKKDFSNYRTHIIVQHGDSEVAIKAAKDLANKHPD
ncbi:MAG: hypothetical protein FE834_06775, partial [Gammaproteobacteria bacterium]|nr:hypothetical protein [Gammaproteobacteria bacterium]